VTWAIPRLKQSIVWPVTAEEWANPRPGHVIFVGDKVAMGQVFL